MAGTKGTVEHRVNCGPGKGIPVFNPSWDDDLHEDKSKYLSKGPNNTKQGLQPPTPDTSAPPFHSDALVAIPEGCVSRSLPKDLPHLVIYTLSFLHLVCVTLGVALSSLQQGQFGTFPWLESV